ncbi:hypothetical protein [Halorubrum sp. CGM5_25_10-8B]|uniref:hypothetical protein n=1 Tax=Halorubrum sp. CGM5_25_10-8B TaxID=2518115 RepID=UPI001F546CAA|nr:hypothetical protein [Halorubrum sp. CGM5_25_10-8B]
MVRSLVDGQFFVRASRFSERGLGTGDAFDGLYRQFDRIGGTHRVVWDEINYLEDANTLLDDAATRASERSHSSASTMCELSMLPSSRFFATSPPTLKRLRHGC